MKKLIYEKIMHHTFPEHTDTPITIFVNIYEHTYLFGLWKTYSYKIKNTRLSWTYMDRVVSDTVNLYEQYVKNYILCLKTGKYKVVNENNDKAELKL